MTAVMTRPFERSQSNASTWTIDAPWLLDAWNGIGSPTGGSPPF
jgi:hypothetical protein